MYDQLSAEFGGNREDYFALAYLMKTFKIDAVEAASIVSFQPNDFGVDAYYFQSTTGNFYLYQFKWSEDHRAFKDSFYNLVKEGIPKVFVMPSTSPQQEQEQNAMINALRSSLIQNKEIIKQVFVNFVFNGEPEKAEQSKLLASLREDLESKNSFIDDTLVVILI